ncbi:hypothetical protein [Kribbella deserti]|uniref:WD40 repeat domain-containing protein n=1 Tax=Kribbella deserti TaxID=1926257 RepID=A0ABV6QDG4_9ACTN
MTKNFDHLDIRLREALNAAADTVPTHATGPGLATRSAPKPATRTWAVAALAAAAVVTAIAVPLTLANDEPSPPASAGQCATPPAVQNPLEYPKDTKPDPQYPWLNTLPFGAAPRVPFTVTGTGGGNYLQDGNLRVPLPAGKEFGPWGRVECGWMGILLSASDRDTSAVGVLSTSGEFRPFGTATGDGMALSPAGDRVAIVELSPGGGSRLVTREIATGREADSVPADPETEVLGWNSSGIFYMDGDNKDTTRLWTIDEAPVPVATDGRRLTVWRTTDRMVLQPAYSQKPGQQDCLNVVEFRSGRLKTVMQRCSARGSGEGTLSPDGKILAANRGPNGVQGYLVPANTPTKASAAKLFHIHHETRWEDNRHVVTSAGLGTDRSVTLRCDVIDGDCEKISYGSQKAPSIGLGGL